MRLSESDQHRDRAARIFEYLIELARLRSKTVHDIDQYTEVFWFESIPSDRDCYCVVHEVPESDRDETEWLEIRRRPEPKLPIAPAICRDWIDRDDLRNDEEPPQLRPRIQIPPSVSTDAEEHVHHDQATPQVADLANHPEVQSAWDGFLEQQWGPWATEHRAWKEIQSCYSALFKIHQELQRLGEEYELVVGIGLLTFRPSGQTAIRRHALVAQATLEFDARDGVFTLRPGAEGARLALETDMLPPDTRPSLDQQRSVEDALIPAADTPWDKSIVLPALKAWVHSLDAHGEFHETLGYEESTRPTALIHYAPALILRRRSGQNLIAVLERIATRIRSSADSIPPEILRLVCDPDTFQQSFERLDTGGDQPRLCEPQPVRFPLPSNEEQRRIIEVLDRRRGVLVQGPPGTGKSHTIANLICHLLATGNRVLVTAQTPRALRVLQGKLPSDVAPLCVSILGNDRAALQSLERSVAEISNRYSRWNDQQNDQAVSRLQKQLDEQRQQSARLQAELRSIRERESRKHDVAGKSCRGTAQQIATRLSEAAPQYTWFRDAIAHDCEFPFSPSALQALRTSFLTIDANREAELKQVLPSTDAVPQPHEFLTLVEEERTAKSTVDELSSATANGFYWALRQASTEAVDTLATRIDSLRVSVQTAQQRPLEWISAALHDVLIDNDTPWKTLRRLTADGMAELPRRAQICDEWSCTIPDGIPHDQVLADAGDLREHLASDGGLGWFLFTPNTVKRCRYLVNSVRVDGRLCRDAETLGKLVERLDVTRRIDRLWTLWGDKVDRVEGPLALQVAQLQEYVEALDAVLNVERQLVQAKQACQAIQGLVEPSWGTMTTVEVLRKTCEAVCCEKRLQDITEKLASYQDEVKRTLTEPNPHPLARQLNDSISDRDVEGYAACHHALHQLASDRQRLKERDSVHAELAQLAPRLAEDLPATADSTEWDSRLPAIVDAWNWSRAQSWLGEYLRPGREEELELQIRTTISDVGHLTARLAGAESWRFFFQRMTEGQRQHLNAWQQAVKRIGKGTGKYATKHRRDAQSHLEECRGAIPAWVMPLFRVFETVTPQPEMFDVVIVDEASQCGPEALVLLYLAKKVVVVGDDQQISPEAVGVNQGAVDLLIRQHLTEIDHSDSFAATSSFFDHGVIRYGNRIVLREHFRCMPEIIRFSNDLCYSGHPLIPLRQYPPDRLKPVVTHHVSGGYREGTGSRVFNRPEAEAVVQAIVACCRDPHYASKTMGVISLQGEAQARLIESMLLEELDAEEIEERRIICGDAYSFQGDERHVMFLTMVAAANARIGALTKESDKRRFNVAASRAMDQMWLFHSVCLDDLSSSCLRYELLKHCSHPGWRRLTTDDLSLDEIEQSARTADRARHRPPNPFDSWFEVDVFLAIVRRGYRVVPQYEVANYRIDLVVDGLMSRLAVECDGDEWHGVDQYEQDAFRQRTLERCGWRFCRIRGCEFYHDPEQTLVRLWDALDALGIEPATDDIGAKVVEGYAIALNSISSQTVPRDQKAPTGQTPTVLVPEVPHQTVNVERATRDDTIGQTSQEGDAGRFSSEPPSTMTARQLRSADKSAEDDSHHEHHEQELIDQASSIQAEVWFKMSHWAKENGYFRGRDRSMLYNMGRKKANEEPITLRQARYALSLYRQALEKGFEQSRPQGVLWSDG